MPKSKKPHKAGIGSSRDQAPYHPVSRSGTQPGQRIKNATRHDVEVELRKQRSHCSAAVQREMSAIVNTSLDRTTNVMPTSGTPLRYVNGTVSGVIAPISVKGGTFFESKRMVRIYTGQTTKFGFMTIYPKKTGWNWSIDAVGTTVDTATVTSVQGALGLGVGSIQTTINARTAPPPGRGLRCFQLKHLSIKLKTNSESVMSRGGRAYLGHKRGSPNGMGGATAEQTATFSEFDLALLEPGNRPTYIHIPSGEPNLAMTSDAAVDFTLEGEEYVVCILEDSTGGQLYEFEVTVKGIYFGEAMPFDSKLSYDPATFACATTCVKAALPPSRALLGHAIPKATGNAYREADAMTLIQTPKSLLASAWNTIQGMWRNGGSDLLRQAAVNLL